MCTKKVQAPLDELLLATEAASVARCSAHTITNLCTKGKIKAVKVGNKWRVNRDSLLEYLGLTAEEVEA